MTKPVVLLLDPAQPAEDVMARRRSLSRTGYELAGMVDPTQQEGVTIRDGVFVTNSIPMAAAVCRTDTFLYADTILHTNALEVSKWQSNVC